MARTGRSILSAAPGPEGMGLGAIFGAMEPDSRNSAASSESARLLMRNDSLHEPREKRPMELRTFAELRSQPSPVGAIED